MRALAPLPLALALALCAPRAAHAQRGHRVLAVLGDVAATHRVGRYSHDTRVDLRAGRFEWDCSAMAAWVLRRSAPESVRALPHARPVAVDFYRAIARAPTVPSRGPWMHVRRVIDARPGDVLAWPRPRWFPSRNTGHVAFVIAAPVPVAGGVLVRVADATSVGHEDDTRRGQTGFGHGTLLIATDPVTGAGTAYGWAGRYTPAEWMVTTPVVVGRPLR